MLNFNGRWRFESPGEISPDVIRAFLEVIGKIANQGDRQAVFERYKRYFAGSTGSKFGRSSNTQFAQQDMLTQMQHAAVNAPLFIEAFYEGCESLRSEGIVVPEIALSTAFSLSTTLDMRFARLTSSRPRRMR